MTKQTEAESMKGDKQCVYYLSLSLSYSLSQGSHLILLFFYLFSWYPV